MSHSKFSLADVLTVLGALVFGFICYLSFSFFSLGQTFQSIGLAVVIALLLGGSAFGIKLLKCTNRNFKSAIIWECIMILLFAVVAFLAIFPFSHYFAVLSKKSEIQSKVSIDIKAAEDMFSSYETYVSGRETSYRRNLNTAVNEMRSGVSTRDYNNFGFVPNIPDSDQINNKLSQLHEKLILSNYSGVKGTKTIALDWLAKAKNTLESEIAFTFRVVSVVNEVDSKVTSWLNDLKTLSAKKATGEIGPDFNYPITFNNVKDKITDFSSPSLVSIICAVGLYLLMLLSYFITRRHPRYPGLKLIFGTRESKINEL